MRLIRNSSQATNEQRLTKSSSRRISLVLLFIALVPVFLNAFSYFHKTNEDALISLRYAINLADGYGLVSDTVGVPQQGYSNLLWVLMIAFFRKILAIDALLLSKVLGCVSLVGVVIISMKVLVIFESIITREYSIAISDNIKKQWHPLVIIIGTMLSIGLSAYMAYWSAGGLETTFYTLLVVSILYLVVKGIANDKVLFIYFSFCIGFLSWITRPEGLLNIAVITVVVIIYSILNRQHRKMYLLATIFSITCTIVAISAVLAFNTLYFGDPRSNPQIIKLTLANAFGSARPYLGDYFYTKGSAFFVILFGSIIYIPTKMSLYPKSSPSVSKGLICYLSAVLLLLSQVFMIFYSKGDYMPYSRFIISHYPIMVIIIGWSLLIVYYSKIRIPLLMKSMLIIGILMVIGWSALIREKVNEKRWWEAQFVSPYEALTGSGMKRVAQILGEELAVQTRRIYATSEHGYIPFAIGQKLPALGLDIFGLNQKEIARNFSNYPLYQAFFANRDWILVHQPEIITMRAVTKNTDGQIKLDSTVHWFSSSYFQSPFFIEHYNLTIPFEGSNEWAMFRLKGDSALTNLITTENAHSHLDQLMHGIRVPGSSSTPALPVIEPQLEEIPTQAEMPNMMEVADLARVVLSLHNNERYICMAGMGDGKSIDSRELQVFSIAVDDRAVGDSILGEVHLNGLFRRCFVLPDTFPNSSQRGIGGNILITIASNIRGGPVMYRFANGSASYRAFYLHGIWLSNTDESIS